LVVDIKKNKKKLDLYIKNDVYCRDRKK